MNVKDQKVEELRQQIRAAKNEIAVLLTPYGKVWDPSIELYRDLQGGSA
jgi:H2-forming N5,N10-methylenetetrahydromethanopterin dehydrogenase-like enzyme